MRFAWAFGSALAVGLVGVALAHGAAAADALSLKPAAEASAEYDHDALFDELRLGASAFLKGDVPEEEHDIFIDGEVLFRPLWGSFDSALLDALLRPRPHLGATVSVGDGTDQLYGGFTWTLPLPGPLFLEAGFGGTVHNGNIYLDEGKDGVQLGCRVLFRESLGLGVELGPHWRAIAGVNHSSHASLCDEENDGLSHIGATLGYRF